MPDDTLDLVMMLDIQPMFFRCENCQRGKGVKPDMSEILETRLTEFKSGLDKLTE